MNALERIAYLVATEPVFCQTFQADPQAAITAQGLTLSPEELGTVLRLRHLLVTPPQELAALLLALNPPEWPSALPGVQPAL